MHPSFLIEPIPYRRCRRCNWRGPGYLASCLLCTAAMGDLCIDQIAIITPAFEDGEPSGMLWPAAVLAVELSAAEWLLNSAQVNDALGVLEQMRVNLIPHALRHTLPGGVFCVLCTDASFHEVVEQAAQTAANIQTSLAKSPLEVRAGVAHGLVAGRQAWTASITRMSARLTRAAQPGQTLTTLAVAKELEQQWSIAPVGPLPRRYEDRIDQAMLLEGRKEPVATPSAFARDDDSEIVGRDAELAALSEQLEQVVTSRGTSWCAVIAPAGGGKSKLLRSWIKNLLDQSVAVVGAAASPMGGRPLSLIDDLCRQLGAPVRTDGSHREACRVLAMAIQRAICEQPVVLIIDDLHWCDEASLETLKLFSNEKPFAGCLVILALRESFLGSLSWLTAAIEFIRLPALELAERKKIARRLLPENSFDALADRLAGAPAAGNPLYIEQCAGYLRESAYPMVLPDSLHDVILKRLDALSRSLDRPGGERLTAGQLRVIEDQICAWLDRLETGDYAGRLAIAQYLGLLQNMDCKLVILKSILGMPQVRNRRLLTGIERFYSASYCERFQVIESLALQNRGNAVHAAQAGAQQAFETMRIDDAIGYLELAVRYSEGQQQMRNMMQLGDAYFLAGSHKAARQAYRWARHGARGDLRLRALCQRQLGRIALALGSWGEAKNLLEKALPGLDAEERFAADCEHVDAIAQLRQLNEARREIERLQAEAADLANVQSERALHRLQKARLRVSLIARDSALDESVSACANSFVFEDYAASERVEFVETVRLFINTGSVVVSAALMNEADRVSAMIRNAVNDTKTQKPAAAFRRAG